jgi:hypothetical protein
MIAVQPPFIKNYFSDSKKLPAKSGVNRTFFLSWEDALWHLVSVKNIKKGSTVMLPDFFCGNVADHMIEHGLKVKYYPINGKLEVNFSKFLKILKKEKPSILVIFHPVGIESGLLIKKQWLRFLSEKTVLIEDSVHRVIDPQKIKFISKNHFLIDSLRKVVPVQGSFLYSTDQIPQVSLNQTLLTFVYRSTVFIEWAFMQINLVFAYRIKNKRISKIFGRFSEESMLRGYDVIGKSHLASPGIKFMENLADKINIERIKNAKEMQFKLYKSGIKKTSGKNFWLPVMKLRDGKNLRGFPLIMKNNVADKFLKYMRDAGVLLRFELNDSSWSEKQKIVYLPMGLHLKTGDIRYIINLLNKL